MFEGKTHVDVCIQHVTQAPTPPSKIVTRDIPPELEAIIMRCLQKLPADRFASATDLAEALAKVPRGDDWNRTQATEFWTKFHEQEATKMAQQSGVPTITITVDIAARSPRIEADASIAIARKRTAG